MRQIYFFNICVCVRDLNEKYKYGVECDLFVYSQAKTYMHVLFDFNTNLILLITRVYECLDYARNTGSSTYSKHANLQYCF